MGRKELHTGKEMFSTHIFGSDIPNLAWKAQNGMSAEKLVEPEFKRWTGWLMLDIEEPDQTNLFLYATFKLLTQGRLVLSVSVLERKRLIL